MYPIDTFCNTYSTWAQTKHAELCAIQNGHSYTHFFSSFLFCSLSKQPTHRRYRGLQLHLITFNDTHIFGVNALDEGSAHRRELPENAEQSQETDRHPCHQWNVSPHSQQASGHRPTPWTARPPESFIYIEGNNLVDLNVV